MNRLRNFFLAKLAGLTLLLGTPLVLSQAQEAPAKKDAPATLRIFVPANATVEIEGAKTRQTGEQRVFASPPLTPGKNYYYTIKATWSGTTGEPIVRERKVQISAGQETIVDLRLPAKTPDKTPKDTEKPKETEKPKDTEKLPKVKGEKAKLDVQYVATPHDVVEKMLEMANVTDADTVYDLGCGDGRIVITAAKKFGAKGVGIDLDPARVKKARENVKKAGVEKLVEIRQANLFDVADLGKASVVTLYLMPTVNLKLEPILKKELKKGTRIVSHAFDMGEWHPLKEQTVKDSGGSEHFLYLWEIGAENKGPIKKEDVEAPKLDNPKKKDKEEPKKKEEPEARGRELLSAPALALADEPKKKPKLDVPYVPTPQEVVDKMLEVAKVGKDDVVYDLGCGDGRIPVTAAKKYGAKGVGIDLDPERVKESLDNVKKNKVEKLVEIREGNALKVEDIGKASVVTLYLLPEVNLKLRPILQKELKPGSRIVSHDFKMGDWKPEKELTMKDKDGDEHAIYLWTIPAKKKEGDKKEGSLGLPGGPALALADREPDVIYVPTPQAVVDKMLELAKVKKDDVVYDLGCGDGRIPVTAAKKYGCKATGFDIDPERVKESLENVKKNKVEDLVKIEKKDIFTQDLSGANVITLYLLPSLNVKLIPQLEKLKPGSRIVSHDFDMKGVKPDQVIKMNAKDDRGNEREHTIYVWTVPLKKEAEKKEQSSIRGQVPAKALALADDKEKTPDVIYVPTPQAVVDKMLEMAKVKKGDLVYDLGCGDGRIPVTAAKKYGCKAIGYDIDPDRIKESLENVKKNKVEDLVKIEKKDIFTLDLSDANVITLYLLPRLNVKLIPQLEKLKPGSRIVSHDFDMAGVKPDDVVKITAKDDRGNEREHTIYLWTVPLKKEKKE